MLRKILLTALAFMAFGLTKFVFNLAVFRVFSSTYLGEINEILAFFLLIPLFYAPGLGILVSKFASELIGSKEPHKSEQVFTLSFIVVAVISMVCTIGLVLLFPRLIEKFQAAPETIYALAPMLLLYSLYVVLRTSYYGFDRVPSYLRNEFISSMVFFAVLGAALVTRSTLLALFPFASHSVVFVAIALFDFRKQFRFHALFAEIAQDLRRYAYFFFCTIANSLAGPGAFHLGILLTGRLTSDRDVVGRYSVLLYAFQPLYLLPIAVSMVLMPTVSHHHGAGRGEESLEAAQQSFGPMFLVVLLIWGGATILGWEAVAVIFGETNPTLLVAYEVILFGVCLYLISMPQSVLLNSTQHIGVVALGGMVSAAAAIALWWGLLPIEGFALLAAAIGYTLLQIGKAVWAMVAVRRLFRWRGHIGRGVMLTVPVVAVLGAVSLNFRNATLHILIAGIFTVSFGVLYARRIKTYLERLTAALRADPADK